MDIDVITTINISNVEICNRNLLFECENETG